MLQQLQPALRAGQWQVTVAVHDTSRIIAVWPGFHETAFGLAVDVGSTTIAAHLCDLVSGEVVASAGRMNPQIRFGEDLMSRVSYSMMNPGGAAQMTAAVREALSELAAEVAAAAGIEKESILEVTLVGNPIMHHLVLGIDPVELGGAPFALAIDRAVTVTAAELGIALHPNARVYALPCIAGHVGADTAGVILAERPDLTEEMTLLVDVGTNAEIVLGNSKRLVACSSPTGPAFEGAQISCGQRAAPGAIERVRIDRETLEPRFKVIGSDLWSDDPGFADAVTSTGVTGVCGSGIIEVIAEMYLAGIITQDGVIDGALAARSPRVVASGRTYSYVLHEGAQTLCITQNDVRAIQLAKAALMAGIRLLMERLGVETLDRIRLAGAFGAHIDVMYATVLGMIPDCDLSQGDFRRQCRRHRRAHRAARFALAPDDRVAGRRASRRSRPRSSRGSRSISSRRWRFRTRRRTIPTCARSWNCRRSRPRRSRRARREAAGVGDRRDLRNPAPHAVGWRVDRKPRQAGRCSPAERVPVFLGAPRSHALRESRGGTARFTATLLERVLGDGASGWSEKAKPPRTCARAAAFDTERRGRPEPVQRAGSRGLPRLAGGHSH